ncbi:hypothetical protein K438DRAFT_1761246 [Mycena galopus ATCC 62051]|nr:hypothetical protein K438DRAFT_1761246 [Mycena galopus ATCC 62051]
MRLASILTIALRAMNSLLGTALILNSPVTLYTNGKKLAVGEGADLKVAAGGVQPWEKVGKRRSRRPATPTPARGLQRPHVHAWAARGRAGPTERGVLDAPLGAVAVIRVSAPCVFNILQQQYLRLKTGLQKGIDLGDAH